MEVFPEVRAIIDLSIFKDKANEALDIIRSGKSSARCQNCSNSYEVIDSFEKIDEIHTELWKLKMKPSGAQSTKSTRADSTRSTGADSRSTGAESTRSKGAESTRSSGAKSTQPPDFKSAKGSPSSTIHASMISDHVLTLNVTVFNYIEAIYGSYIQRIEKDFDVIMKKSTLLGDSVKVQFIQKRNGKPSEGATERFLCRYQTVATNLRLEEVKHPGSIVIKKEIVESLQKKFPKVWVTEKETGFFIIGDPIDVKNAKEFLKMQFSQIDTHAMPDITNSNRRPSLTSEYKPNSNSAAAGSKQESKDEDTTCPICLEEFKDREILKKCKHSFCKECINVAFKTKSACPLCGEVYGEIRGNQPEGGRMTHKTMAMHLPGYEKFETIEIYYVIPDGIQGAEHPNPGQRYHGTTRTAYLPENPEGKKVCKLLQRAFAQRLTFTVGTSSTTGRSNVVTWNDIHHKTNTTGGPSMFGYPDPTYLTRVQDELKAKGIY